MLDHRRTATASAGSGPEPFAYRRAGNPTGVASPARDASGDEPWPPNDSIAFLVVTCTILWSVILGTALRLIG